MDDQAPSPAVMRLQHLLTAQAQSKTQLEVAMKDTSAGGAEEVRTLKAQLQQAEHQIVEARTEVQQEVLAGGGGVPPQAAPTFVERAPQTGRYHHAVAWHGSGAQATRFL